MIWAARRQRTKNFSQEGAVYSNVQPEFVYFLVPFVGPVMKKAAGQRSEQAFMEQDEHSCDVYAFFGMRSQDFLRNTGLFEDISKRVHIIFGVWRTDIRVDEIFKPLQLNAARSRFEYTTGLGAVYLLTGEIGSGKSTENIPKFRHLKTL